MNFSCRFYIAKGRLQRILFLLFIGCSSLQIQSQVDQRVAMGDKYFAAGEYYTAAGLYEQYLNPSKKEIIPSDFPLNTRRYNLGGSGAHINKFDILYKQAESYRLANYWSEAAAKYKECFEKEPGTYPEAYYWYAVCLRSLGKYDAAEENLKIFLSQNTSGSVRQEAEKEFLTIRFIKKQLTRPDTVLYKINKTHSSFSKEKGLFALNQVRGNQFIFTSTLMDASAAGDVNPNHSRLFYAELSNGTLQNPEPVTIEAVDASFNQGAGCISADGKYLYFTQWKKVNGKNVSSIYYSKKQDKGWGIPDLISSVNKAGYSSRQPFCSADGKILFFASDMSGGAGGFDIWSAPILPDGTTGTAVNAGSVINTAGDEQAPFYHGASNQLVFASNGFLGMGGFDLYSAKKNEEQWAIPENMGYPVNSSRDDIYFFAPDEKNILKNAIIGSDRGSECCLEIYSVIKAPKKKMIKGIVQDCKNGQLLADATVVMNDISGKSLQVTTGPDGRFSFELAGDMGQQTFHISKENYKEKMAISATESINESDLLIDIYNNVPVCLDPVIKEEKKLIIKAENVVTLYFDFDKNNLKERERKILDSVYNVLAENKFYTIQVSGYTDGLGTNDYNIKLSNRRAKACADYLILKGLEASRIGFVSFGECCPAEMEIINGRDNPDGRSKNRRALINISKE